jgi:uncharacterized membrane protein (DUF106 family)
MRKILMIIVLIALLNASFAVAAAQETARDNRDTVWKVLKNIDGSIVSLRKGDTGGATNALRSALEEYNNIKSSVENVDDNLDNKIEQAFNQLYYSPNEGDIRALRADVSIAASKIGASVSFVYEHAMFFILAIAVVFSLIITLITKRVVDWPKVKQMRKEVDDWRKQLLEAQRRKDFKRLYKLQQDQKRIMGLQGQVMMASFKPAIFYIIPYFLLWMWLGSLYSGWIVAWLPFNLPWPSFGFWPFLGTCVSLGFAGWFLLSYFGFSSIWRKLLIGD